MTGNEPVSAQPLAADSPTVTAWADARKRLGEAETYWLATVRPDDRPHVMPVLGVWVDSAFCFCASETSRKARNLEHNSHCVVTLSSPALPALDLVVEGSAAKVRDEAKLHRVAGSYASKYGWIVTVRDRALYGDGAPTAGPPPYVVFGLPPAVTFGFPGVTGTDEEGKGNVRSFSPTRWRF
jgi:hypothetical protein